MLAVAGGKRVAGKKKRAQRASDQSQTVRKLKKRVRKAVETAKPDADKQAGLAAQSRKLQVQIAALEAKTNELEALASQADLPGCRK
jgi:hypothetical protein